MSVHPTSAQLEGFADGGLSAEEARAVFAHLSQGCPQCSEAFVPFLFARLARDRVMPVDVAAYGDVVRRAFAASLSRQRLLEQERARLRPLLPAFLSIPIDERAELPAVESGGLEAYALAEGLLDLATGQRHRDPGRMLFLARLARRTTQQLDPERCGREPVADLQARAWAELGNAHRVVDELDAAEGCLARAVAQTLEGSGDPLLHARILDLLASLRNSQRRFPESLALLDEVRRICLGAGERHLAGRAAISKGIYAGYQGDPEAGMTFILEGLAELEPGRDPDLRVSAVQGLLWFMVDCGQFQEARRLLWQSRLRTQVREPLALLKIRWLEGRIAAGLGELDRAEAELRHVRDGFDAQGQGYNAALASFDLAIGCLRQGRAPEARALVGELVEVFRSLGIEREAFSSLLLLYEACRQERETLAMLETVAGLLRRAQGPPAPRGPALSPEDPPAGL